DTPKPPIEVNPRVLQPLSDLIMRLLAREPSERPASAEIASKVLASADDGHSTQELPRVQPPHHCCGPHWVVTASLIVLAFVSAALLFSGSVQRWLHPGPSSSKAPDRPATPPGPPAGTPEDYPRVRLDNLQREKIDPYELRVAGRGDPAKAPAE